MASPNPLLMGMVDGVDGDFAIAAFGSDTDEMRQDCADRGIPFLELGAAGSVLSMANSMRRAIESLKPDVVEAHTVRPSVATALLTMTMMVRPGLLAVAGGKLTTYRSMAAEIVDRAAALLGCNGSCPSTTADAPLPGAPTWAWEERLDSAQARALREEDRLPPETVDHLLSTYGARALEVARRSPDGPIAKPLPHRWAEVDHAVEKEMALRLDDVLIRRTQLFHRAPDQALGLARPVALRMAGLLGWDEQRVGEEIARYRDLVDSSRRYLQESTGEAQR